MSKSKDLYLNISLAEVKVTDTNSTWVNILKYLILEGLKYQKYK